MFFCVRLDSSRRAPRGSSCSKSLFCSSSPPQICAGARVWLLILFGGRLILSSSPPQICEVARVWLLILLRGRPGLSPMAQNGFFHRIVPNYSALSLYFVHATPCRASGKLHPAFVGCFQLTFFMYNYIILHPIT